MRAIAITAPGSHFNAARAEKQQALLLVAMGKRTQKQASK